MSKIMYKDKQILGCISDSKYVAYDNTGTGLSATNAQDAITELNGNLSDSGILFNSSVSYQKRYGFVYASFSGVHVNAIHTWETIATLPEGFRPSNTISGVAYSTDLLPALYQIEVSGNVRIFASNVSIGLSANTMFIAK